MGNMSLGLLLMVVGMVTVFIILIIVIEGSRLMISIVNRIAPAQPAPKPYETEEEPVKAVLEAAVAQLTGGKGRIVRITKTVQ